MQPQQPSATASSQASARRRHGGPENTAHRRHELRTQDRPTTANARSGPAGRLAHATASEAGIVARSNRRTTLLRFALRLELAVILLDERADLVGHPKQFVPLLLVEGDRKAP